MRRWSCAHSTQIREGDRLFLIRQGEEPRGIFASGLSDSDWYEALHWDETKARAGVTTHYVDVRFDVLLNPKERPILAREFLDASPFSDQHWDTQSSGISIREHVAVALEEEWVSFSDLETPQEVPGASTYAEGAIGRITAKRVRAQPEGGRALRRPLRAHLQRVRFRLRTDLRRGWRRVHPRPPPKAALRDKGRVQGRPRKGPAPRMPQLPRYDPQENPRVRRRGTERNTQGESRGGTAEGLETVDGRPKASSSTLNLTGLGEEQIRTPGDTEAPKTAYRRLGRGSTCASLPRVN